MEDLDAVVVDPDDFTHEDNELTIGRAPTKPLPKVGRIEIHLDETEGLVAFLETMARILKERRRIVVTIE